MGLPSINIIFTEAASNLLVRAQKGVLAVILLDSATAVLGGHTFTSVDDIPAAMSNANKAYIIRAFVDADNKPSKVLCYVLPSDAENLSEATEWLSSQRFNWLVGPPHITPEAVAELTAWVKTQRNNNRLYKAVLPEEAANDKAIVNFVTKDIEAAGEIYTPAEYCSRIAGLIAGTPLTSSITFAVLPEVTAVEELTRAEQDAADEAGKLILIHDGRKVKAGRGVTSLVALGTGDSESYKKIKVVETLDLISEDLTYLAEDNYIGKYANSYDNRLLLVSAIKGYFTTLENEGVLKSGSTVDIDSEGIVEWLNAHSVNPSEMTEQEIREYDTGDEVFLVAVIKVFDAIEDIRLKIQI